MGSIKELSPLTNSLWVNIKGFNGFKDTLEGLPCFISCTASSNNLFHLPNPTWISAYLSKLIKAWASVTLGLLYLLDISSAISLGIPLCIKAFLIAFTKSEFLGLYTSLRYMVL